MILVISLGACASNKGPRFEIVKAVNEDTAIARFYPSDYQSTLETKETMKNAIMNSCAKAGFTNAYIHDTAVNHNARSVTLPVTCQNYKINVYETQYDPSNYRTSCQGGTYTTSNPFIEIKYQCVMPADMTQSDG